MINHRNQDIFQSKEVLLRTTLRQPASLGVPRGHGEAPSPYSWGGVPHLLPGLLLRDPYLYLGRSLSVNPRAGSASQQPASQGVFLQQECGPAPCAGLRRGNHRQGGKRHPAEHLRISSPGSRGGNHSHITTLRTWALTRYGGCLFLETRVGSGIRLR